MTWIRLLLFLTVPPLLFSIAYVSLLALGRLWVRWLYRRPRRVKIPSHVPAEWVAEYREQL